MADTITKPLTNRHQDSNPYSSGWVQQSNCLTTAPQVGWTLQVMSGQCVKVKHEITMERLCRERSEKAERWMVRREEASWGWQRRDIDVRRRRGLCLHEWPCCVTCLVVLCLCQCVVLTHNELVVVLTPGEDVTPVWQVVRDHRQAIPVSHTTLV